jgi:hypothetical protein
LLIFLTTTLDYSEILVVLVACNKIQKLQKNLH